MANTGELLLTDGVAVLVAIVELDDGKGIELEGRNVGVVVVVEFEVSDELLAAEEVQRLFILFLLLKRGSASSPQSFPLSRRRSSSYLAQHSQTGLPTQHSQSLIGISRIAEWKTYWRSSYVTAHRSILLWGCGNREKLRCYPANCFFPF